MIGCCICLSPRAYAKESSATIKSDIYEFASNAHYEFSSATTSGGNAFGSFTISGDLKNAGSQNGVPAYSVNSEKVDFHYGYSPSQLDVPETEWHLIEDKAKKIDGISLDKNILSGAIMIQSSKNGVDWITDMTVTDVFTPDTDLSNALYSTTGIQLQ